MSQETVIAFIAKVHTDSALSEKFMAITKAKGAVDLAKSTGFDITESDFIRHLATVTSELSDEQLEGISGGSPFQIAVGVLTMALVLGGGAYSGVIISNKIS